MASFARLIGASRKGGASTAAANASVVEELREAKDLLEKRVAHLERQKDKELTSALEHKKTAARLPEATAKNAKNAALACLKRSKMIDQELDSLQEQRLKLDTQEHAFSSLKFAQHTIAAERRATLAIKALTAQMGSIEGLEGHRENMEETLETAYELLGLASEPISNPALRDAGDDDELLAELDQLVEAQAQNDLEKELTQLGQEIGRPSASPATTNSAMPSFPEAPREDVATRRRREEDEARRQDEKELAQLEASMAMPMLGMAAPMMVAMEA